MRTGRRHVGSGRVFSSILLATALVGFYKLCGVDLTREQTEAALGPKSPPYDVDEQGLSMNRRSDPILEESTLYE